MKTIKEIEEKMDNTFDFKLMEEPIVQVSPYKEILWQDYIAIKEFYRNEILALIKFEAEQRISQAKGEAEAIKIQAEAINSQGGTDYVQLQAIKQWKGEVPQIVGGGIVPFINIPLK